MHHVGGDWKRKSWKSRPLDSGSGFDFDFWEERLSSLRKTSIFCTDCFRAVHDKAFLSITLVLLHPNKWNKTNDCMRTALNIPCIMSGEIEKGNLGNPDYWIQEVVLILTSERKGCRAYARQVFSARIVFVQYTTKHFCQLLWFYCIQTNGTRQMTAWGQL